MTAEGAQFVASTLGTGAFDDVRQKQRWCHELEEVMIWTVAGALVTFGNSEMWNLWRPLSK